MVCFVYVPAFLIGLPPPPLFPQWRIVIKLYADKATVEHHTNLELLGGGVGQQNFLNICKIKIMSRYSRAQERQEAAASQVQEMGRQGCRRHRRSPRPRWQRRLRYGLDPYSPGLAMPPSFGKAALLLAKPRPIGNAAFAMGWILIPNVAIVWQSHRIGCHLA